MTPNGPEVRELLHIIGEADRRGRPITQFEALKALFLADRSHLNEYGRPVTFDAYMAMKDGPVASLAYDVLKGPGANAEAGIVESLWHSKPAGRGKIHFSRARRAASDEVLSESDVEALSAAISSVLKWGVTLTWHRVHADPAYKQAWARRTPDNQAPAMEPSPDVS